MLGMNRRCRCENCGEYIEDDLPDLNYPYDDVDLCIDCRDPDDLEEPGDLSELTLLRLQQKGAGQEDWGKHEY